METQNIELIPNDKDLFKKELLSSKCAEVFLIYDDGSASERIWKANKFDASSDLMNNIRTHNWIKEDNGHLVKAIYRIMSRKFVQYYDDVPMKERDESFRMALEYEYPSILGFAIKILGSTIDGGLGFLRHVPIYLSKETPIEYYRVSQSYLRKLSEKQEKQEKLTDEEYQILEVGAIKECVIGRFFPEEEPYIEIYYNNIFAHTKKERLGVAINCLAHEYMHFIHYSYATKCGADDPLSNEKLNEALADFFGVLYSLNCERTADALVAEERYKSWRCLWGSGWPYAYALYFVKHMPNPLHIKLDDYYKYGCIDKLSRVIGFTTDVAEAFDVLKH